MKKAEPVIWWLSTFNYIHYSRATRGHHDSAGSTPNYPAALQLGMQMGFETPAQHEQLSHRSCHDLLQTSSSSLDTHEGGSSVFDEVEPFYGEIETGFYCINTDNFFPFKSVGWYDADLVYHAYQCNIIETKNISL
jgi:hypothetical protein